MKKSVNEHTLTVMGSNLIIKLMYAKLLGNLYKDGSFNTCHCVFRTETETEIKEILKCIRIVCEEKYIEKIKIFKTHNKIYGTKNTYDHLYCIDLYYHHILPQILCSLKSDSSYFILNSDLTIQKEFYKSSKTSIEKNTTEINKYLLGILDTKLGIF
jgi:hypothetical protein